MGAGKVGFEASLAKDVVEAGKCVGCGACVAVCPHTCLALVQGQPSLVKECKLCGMCAQACPRHGFSQGEMEKFVFGRTRKPEEPFGVYRRLVVAQATDEKTREACQDGGVATALLVYALENGYADSAVVAGSSREKSFYPEPKLASNLKEVLECAGTKYTCSPNLLLLSEACKDEAVAAFVGTPCQIQAVRKMQAAGLTRQTGCLNFLVGLICSGCFTYEGLMEKFIRDEKGVDLHDVKKLNIKGKLLVTTSSGVIGISLAEIKQFHRGSCGDCGDFSSELADISVGGLGLDGWTLTVVRTEKGEELFSGAEQAGFLRSKPLDAEANAHKLLVKLSAKKRTRLSE